MPIEQIRALVTNDFNALNTTIIENLSSQVVLINQIGKHIVKSGGKRLRPLLVLLSAKCFSYSGSDHIHLAAIIELIHTATLLHDDVVDESKLRRNQQTANAIWDNSASVLVGDFVYSRTFQMMVGLNRMDIMAKLSDTTNAIAEGEVLQLMNCNNPNTTESDYLRIIEYKTAILFAAATELGAMISDRQPHEINALREYGHNIGMAFQIVDDILDYTANSDELGKNIGDDLAEGKPTLPLIYALTHASPEDQTLLRDAITHSRIDSLEKIQSIIVASHAIEYTKELAQQYVDQAIRALSDISAAKKYKDALIDLANFALSRSY